jgi:flavin-dependent dehydrogenase
MIELHFFRELLPGYFWIFPLPGNNANVGLGVPSHVVSRKKLNLKKIFQHIIENEPSIRDRFSNAKPLEDIKGYGLPLGSKKRPVSAERVILTGDAAGLINPCSGEGIANALRSGRVGAGILLRAIEEKNFSAQSMKRYDRELYKRVWVELKISNIFKVLAGYPVLLDFLLRKAEKNSYVKAYLHQVMTDGYQWKFTSVLRFLFNLSFR